MKKGLILALAMVAMVAVVLPVGAIAPVIEPLPSVIIGDAGDVTTDATPKSLFRYTNIMNIATSDKIQWKNADIGFGPEQMHAYYMSSPAGQIQASTAQRIVTEVSPEDIAAIGASGARPAAVKEITDNAGDGGTPDFFWLSLANNMSAATNAYTATATANGKTLAQYTTLGDAVVTLVLADGDFPTTAASQAEFTVFTVPGSEDGFSTSSVSLYTEDFSGSQQNGWFWKFNPGAGITSTPAGTVTANGLTMQRGATASAIYFGTWTSGSTGSAPATVIAVDQAAQTGNIMRATFTLASTGATIANTPGYRLFYQSEAFTHIGGVSVNSSDSVVGSSAYAPIAGTNKDVVLVWSPPFTLSEMGDAGKLATVQPSKDFRDYFLAYDLVGYESAENGALSLVSVSVEMTERPDATAQLVQWGGTGGKNFNATLTTDGWNDSQQDASIDPVTNVGLGLGTANIGPGTITLVATHGTTAFGYKAVGPFATATALTPVVSDKLVRNVVQMSSSSVNTAPSLRLLTLAVRPTNGTVLAFTWVDSLSGDGMKALYAPAANNGPVSPLTTGSTIETYVWTHTAGTGADAGVLEPQVDCYAAGQPVFTGGGNTWPIENATLTMSMYKMEECN